MVIVLLLGILFFLIFLGAPVFLAMIFASLVHWVDVGRDSALIVLVQRFYGGMTSFTLLAIPMFLLAGNIMTKGGLTDRLIGLARAMVGHFKGGLAQINILSSVFFGGISGSAYADIAAMGTVFIPSMKKEGYPEGLAGAITAVSGTMAPMIPPSIVLIVYGSTFGVSIGALFAAGLSVAVLIAICYMTMTYFLIRKLGVPSYQKASFRTIMVALKHASGPLVLPIVVVGGIFGGFFSPTEAGAVAAAYAMFITVVIYRSIKVRDLPKIFLETALTSGAVMMLIGAAFALSYVMAARHVPVEITSVLLNLTSDPFLISILILAMLFIVGLFIDRTTAVLLFGAIVIPIFTTQAGFSSIHTAMIIVMALGIGHLTPPVGGTLLMTALVGKMSVTSIVRYIWPFILLEIAITTSVILFPAISETLPRWLGLGGL
ncbi:TRAP transporter large permease [Halomonas ramblicola]|uniref:TRAP transporter large permease n=1 Tax=Halomonas ramblicola TaxID=747349 RepID=UPI0025B58CB6|nr:TRAP transporter large permease [Halomonas ramblicola]MDN3523178.1 TRAP transporter large permease [Halomonas ramblicola]